MMLDYNGGRGVKNLGKNDNAPKYLICKLLSI